MRPAARGGARMIASIKAEVDRNRDQHGGQPTRIVHLTKASTIKLRATKWFWDERLALGTFALIGGREGIGKSLCVATITADCTRGRLRGAFYGQPRSVVIVATE